MYKTGIPNDAKFHQKTKLLPSRWSILESALKNKNKKIAILDVGCSGGGKLLYLYNNVYRNIQGIDYASEIFKSTWDKYPYLNIGKGNAENLHKFTSNKFDIVYACHFLEHLPNPELSVKKIARILKKRGKYVIGIPYGYNLNNILMRIIQKIIYGKTDHLHAFNLKKITDLLKKYKFKIEKVESEWGSLDFLLDVRINKILFNVPKTFLYPVIRRIYWSEIHYNIIAAK